MIQETQEQTVIQLCKNLLNYENLASEARDNVGDGKIAELVGRRCQVERTLIETLGHGNEFLFLVRLAGKQYVGAVYLHHVDLMPITDLPSFGETEDQRTLTAMLQDLEQRHDRLDERLKNQEDRPKIERGLMAAIVLGGMAANPKCFDKTPEVMAITAVEISDALIGMLHR